MGNQLRRRQVPGAGGATGAGSSYEHIMREVRAAIVPDVHHSQLWPGRVRMRSAESEVRYVVSS